MYKLFCNTNTPIQLAGFSPAGGTWSGTGVTAVAIAASKANLTNKNNIKLEVLGGTLEVSFEKIGETYTNVFLKGPTEYVFEGNITI